jgi:ABC-type transport system substrate-binding protein/DNA-binding SARP family transcriptional activator/sugar lactone lactonase YvrE
VRRGYHPGMDFRVLGGLEVLRAGRPLPLGGRRQRILLAALVLRANAAVSSDVLIEELWGERPPATALHTVHAYASRLRRVLREDGAGASRLTSHPAGYLLQIGLDELDLDRFERLADEGRSALAAGAVAEAAAKLRAALAMWRGNALADLSFEPFARVTVERLEERRLVVLEDRIEADLALGKHDVLVAELRALMAEHPWRERLCAQLMIALYRSGRQAEALAAYRDARARLIEEIGIEPGKELQQLERRILRQDEALDVMLPEADPLVAIRTAGRSITIQADRGLTGVVVAGHRPPSHVGASPTLRTTPTTPAHRTRRGVKLSVSALTVVLVIATLLAGGGGGDPRRALSAVNANAVAFIDPAGPALVGQIDAGGRPAGIAVGFGRLWATVPARGELLVLDPTTYRIDDEIPVGREPTGVAASAEGIWVTDPASGTVSEINPVSRRVVATVQDGTSPAAIAASSGAGALWVADARDGAVTRLDPARAAVVATVATGQPITNLAVGLGNVWVTAAGSGLLISIDARTNRVTALIQIGNGPTSVQVAGGAVWAANPPDGTISRFDPHTGAVRKVSLPDPTALGVAGGALWVAEGTDRPALATVDPTTGTVTGNSPLANPPAAIVGSGATLVMTTLATPAAHRGGTLRVVAGDGVDSVDPGAAYSLNDWQLLSMANDGLLAFAPGDATVVPDLAVSMPLVEDGGRTFTFHLRAGVHYSNGMTVRPEDFRKALEREYQAGTGLAALGVPIAGSQLCQSPQTSCALDGGVTVDDVAQTIAYHLTSPDPAFLFQLALPFGAAVPAGTPAIGAGLRPAPATGPYVISDYLPGRLVDLVRNPRFQPWSAKAQPAGFPDHITVRLGVQPANAAAAVAAGQADIMLDSPPAGALSELERSLTVQIYTASTGQTGAVVLNTRVPPFDQITVRRALALAVDRSQLVQLAGGPDLARATCQILPPDFPGYYPICPSTSDPDPAGVWHSPDIARARTLIAASGTSGMTVTISTVVTDPFKLATGRYFVSLLDALGYRGQLRTYPDDQSYYRQVGQTASDTQIGVFGWAADYPAGSAFFQPLFSCAAFRPSQPFNMNAAGFCDPVIDGQIASATAMQNVNTALANEAWERIDREITDQGPWIPLVNPLAVHLVSSRVGNYQADPAFGIPLDQLWVVG